MSKMFEHLHLVCTCTSTDHLVEVVANDDPQDDDVFWIQVQLHPQRWYWRIWIGLKYIFGYRCSYGHWDSAAFDEDEARKLQKFLNNTLNANWKALPLIGPTTLN